MNYILELYRDQPASAVALFCAAHFLSSFFAIPGGCTALNIGAGAVFGLPLACAIIYPVTMLSAVTGYGVGRRFGSHALVLRAREKFNRLLARLRSADFLFLLTLRLSPVVPFGIMNIACGALRVPWPLYLLSTFVGIFFDVALLSSIGAALQVGSTLAIAFAVLLVATMAARSWLFKSPGQVRMTP
jgi:uncharacterized membrane protein YdjX (TVP38/TMEM64 family)